jgi:hypothetical protein
MECAQKIGNDSTVPEIQCVRKIQHRLAVLASANSGHPIPKKGVALGLS